MGSLIRKWVLAVAAFGLAGTAAAQTFNGAMSGSWWDASRGGEGQFITFETVGSRNVAYLAYFTYTADGRATWHVGNADYTPGAASVSIPLVIGSGARFGAAFNPADVRTASAGTATLTFVSCSQMRLTHTAAPGVTLSLSRLVGPLVGADCGAPAPASASAFTGVVSGSWWNSARGGEGQFITFEQIGARSVAYLAYFTYTADGAATWLVGNADFTAGSRNISIPLVTGAGARFGSAFRSSDVTVASAGTATLSFNTCGVMRISYAGTQSFAHDLGRLVGPLNGLPCNDPVISGSPTDIQLRPLIIAAGGFTGDARAGRTIPSIDAPLPQLGKLLFFSKTLSGDLDTACASCHHPRFAGTDGLSLSVGTGAVNPNVMGPGRQLPTGGFSTSRNSPTFFNIALWDHGLVHDSRVESIGKVAGTNGGGSGIRTPDSAFGVADPNAGPNLPAAQARFPVLSVPEMKGSTAYAGLSDANVRSHIAARIGNYGSGTGALQGSQWLAKFRTAFNSPSGTAESLITFDNIALAIAEYQRSATFTDNAFARYVRGDNDAINEQAKLGALRFFNPVAQNGAQCVVCHKGDRFSNERHTVVAFPQIGPGMGNGDDGTDDFGRERASGNAADRYLYRTPSLLNVELTGPYGHTGSYDDLFDAVFHYGPLDANLQEFVQTRAWCQLPSFLGVQGCNSPTAVAAVTRNSFAASSAVQGIRGTRPEDAMPQLNPSAFSLGVFAQIQAFLRTLTDPCLRDRACYGRWIPRPDEAPDAHQLNATDANGNPL